MWLVRCYPCMRQYYCTVLADGATSVASVFIDLKYVYYACMSPTITPSNTAETPQNAQRRDIRERAKEKGGESRGDREQDGRSRFNH